MTKGHARASTIIDVSPGHGLHEAFEGSYRQLTGESTRRENTQVGQDTRLFAKLLRKPTVDAIDNGGTS